MDGLLKEFFLSLGVDADMQSFARAQLAVKGLEAGLNALLKVAEMAVSAIPNMVAEVANAGRQAELTAEKTGLTTEAVQELGYAASTVNVSSEEMSHGLGHMARSMVEASQGSKEAQQAFSRLGVKVTDSTGKLRGTSDVLDDVADAFAKLKADDPNKQALAMQIFSRAGLELIPVLTKGSAGLRQLAADAHEYGDVLDDSAIATTKDYTDANIRLNAIFQGLKNTIAIAVMPKFTAATKVLGDWIKANRQLIALRVHQVLEVIGRALNVVKEGVLFLGRAAAFAWNGLKLLTETVMNLTGNFSTLGKVGYFVAIGLAAIWALAASPLLALAAAVAFVYLIWDDILTGMRGGKSLIFELFDAWSNFLDKWSNTTDLDDPLWLAMLKEFYTLLAHPEEFWHDFVDGLSEMWEGVKQAFADAWNWIKTAASDVWHTLVKEIEDLVGGMVDWIKKALSTIWDGIKGGARAVADAVNPFGDAGGIIAKIKAKAALEDAGTDPMSAVHFAQAQLAGVVNHSTTVNVTVPPGTDGKGVAAVVADRVNDEWEKNMQEAFSAGQQ